MDVCLYVCHYVDQKVARAWAIISQVNHLAERNSEYPTQRSCVIKCYNRVFVYIRNR